MEEDTTNGISNFMLKFYINKFFLNHIYFVCDNGNFQHLNEREEKFV